jgi:hypothetical protein
VKYVQPYLTTLYMASFTPPGSFNDLDDRDVARTCFLVSEHAG